jgi:hypothetical protein
MLDFRPCVPRDMTPADGDIQRPAGSDLDRELTEAGAHAAGEPDGDLAQGPPEVLRVQSLVKACEPVQEDQIAGASPLARAWPRPGRGVRLYRKRQKLTLGRAAERTRNPAIEKTHDRLEHPVRRKGVTSMNAEDASIEAEHHGAVSMGKDPFDLPETEHGQTIPEQRVQLLTRFPFAPLRAGSASPLPRLHSP